MNTTKEEYGVCANSDGHISIVEDEYWLGKDELDYLAKKIRIDFPEKLTEKEERVILRCPSLLEKYIEHQRFANKKTKDTFSQISRIT